MLNLNTWSVLSLVHDARVTTEYPAARTLTMLATASNRRSTNVDGGASGENFRRRRCFNPLVTLTNWAISSPALGVICYICRYIDILKGGWLRRIQPAIGYLPAHNAHIDDWLTQELAPTDWIFFSRFKEGGIFQGDLGDTGTNIRGMRIFYFLIGESGRNYLWLNPI